MKDVHVLRVFFLIYSLFQKTYMGEMLDERDITLEDLEPSARYTIEVAGQIGLIRSTPGTVTFSTGSLF